MEADGTGMGSKQKHIVEAEKLRSRADECRALAKITQDKKAAASYGRLAQSYDLLAREEESLAGVEQTTRRGRRWWQISFGRS